MYEDVHCSFLALFGTLLLFSGQLGGRDPNSRTSKTHRVVLCSEAAWGRGSFREESGWSGCPGPQGGTSLCARCYSEVERWRPKASICTRQRGRSRVWGKGTPAKQNTRAHSTMSEQEAGGRLGRAYSGVRLPLQAQGLLVRGQHTDTGLVWRGLWRTGLWRRGTVVNTTSWEHVFSVERGSPWR